MWFLLFLNKIYLQILTYFSYFNIHTFINAYVLLLYFKFYLSFKEIHEKCISIISYFKYNVSQNPKKEKIIQEEINKKI